jgi:enamine deaminase RidA (YjgF/YER057c/UK114 family)
MSDNIEEKLKKKGITLPTPEPYASPNRTHGVIVNNVLYLSGHGSCRAAMIPGAKATGKVGGDVTEQEAYKSSRAVAIAMIASIRKCAGSLDRVKRVIRLYGLVNSAPGFNRQFAVIDGASDLFYEVWGPEAGQHARAAVGIAELPRDSAVEIMGEFEISK